MRIYIAGPMTGLPDLNFPAFHDAIERLEALGFEVESPTVNQFPDEVDYTEYLKLGLQQLLTCQAVALLPDWEKSGGARLEVNVAATCGLFVQPLENWLHRIAIVERREAQAGLR